MSIISKIWQRARSPRGLYLVERTASLSLTLVSGIILLRALGPASFAIYGTTVGLGQTAATSARFSLDEMYANRFAAGALNSTQEFRVFVFRAAIGGFAGCLLWVWTDLAREQGGLTLAAVILIALLEALALRETLLQTQGRYQMLSLLGTSRTIFGFSARLGVFLSGIDGVAAMLCIAVAELVIFRCGALILELRKPKTKSQGSLSLSHREISNYLIVTLLSLAYSRMDFLIGSQMLDPAELGNYLAAQRFIEIYAFFATVVGALMMPKVGKLNGTSAFTFALRKSKQMAMLAILICIINIVVVRPLLPIIAGPRFAGIDNYFLILTFGLLPLFCGLPLGRVALAQRLPSVMIWGGIVAVFLNAIFFFSMKDLTNPGFVLAGATVAGNSLGCLVMFVIIWRRATSKPFFYHRFR